MSHVTRSVKLGVGGLWMGLVVSLATSGLLSGQSVGLTLASGTAQPGQTISLDMSLQASGGALPVAVQFRLLYPAASMSVGLTASAAATAAGKSLSCTTTTGAADCVLFGINATPIANGAMAAVSVSVLQGASGVLPLALTNVVVTDAINGIPVTVAGGSVTVSAPPPSVWSITGKLSGGANATVTLGGQASRTTTADGSGNYSFAGVTNGNYTVTPTKAGIAFSPTSRTVTIGGANISGIDFTGFAPVAPALDTTVWTDRSQSSQSLTSPAFSTRQSNELLLALIATDSTKKLQSVRSVTGGGLTWTLVKRTNDQGGTAEIWRAFAPVALSQVRVTATLNQSSGGSITVMSFSGVDASGPIGAWGGNSASRGAPTASLVTTRDQSLVVGVGNDPKAGIRRTLAPGQGMVHEFLDGGSATYWVQGVSVPVAAGLTVSVSDTAPTSSAFNLSVVEIRGTSAPVLQSSNLLRSAESVSGRGEQQIRWDAGQARVANPITGEAEEACSPGGWAAITGSGFIEGEPRAAQTFPVADMLAGLLVEVNGVGAPLLMASESQLNFQCPMLSAGTLLDIRVVGETGEVMASVESRMSPVAPAVFTTEDGFRAVAQSTSTNQLIDAANPARRGEVVRIYASGLGEAEETLPPGAATPLDRPYRLRGAPVTVVFGDAEVRPLFAGLAPGTVGVFQIDVAVPPHVSGAKDVALALKIQLSDGSTRMSNVTRLSTDATE